MPRWRSWSWRGLTAAHGFCVMDGSVWSAISSAGEVLTGNTPDGLDQQIRAHWRVVRDRTEPSTFRFSACELTILSS